MGENTTTTAAELVVEAVEVDMIEETDAYEVMLLQGSAY